MRTLAIGVLLLNVFLVRASCSNDFGLPAFGLPVQEKENKSDADGELAWLKKSVGVWDAEFEVWPQGPDKPSIKFKGVETIRAFGTHWLASDLESEFNGQKVVVHSIIGYDLDRGKLVGMIIDQGPYSATMSGKLSADKKSVDWVTKAKYPDGKPMTQNTSLTLKSDTERTLVLMSESGGKTNKMMEIRYKKRSK